jgi:hypothetical protein
MAISRDGTYTDFTENFPYIPIKLDISQKNKQDLKDLENLAEFANRNS